MAARGRGAAVKENDRWNEETMKLETLCPTCQEWHTKFEAYPKLARCPRRVMIKHRRNEMRWVAFPIVRRVTV